MTVTTELMNPAHSGFQSVHFAETSPGQSALEAAGVRVAVIDGAHAMSKDALMAELARAMKMPEWFGHNWDALDEVLRNLSWLDAQGHVLVIEGAELLWRRSPDLAGTLVSCWTGAADGWTATGRPFHLVFVR